MSQYLESLEVGDALEVKGPLGHFHYVGPSRCANALARLALLLLLLWIRMGKVSH